jgi:hypothetical protein
LGRIIHITTTTDIITTITTTNTITANANKALLTSND